MIEETVVVEQQGEISSYTAKRLAEIVEKFFENPENLRGFEEWKKENERILGGKKWQ